MPKILKTKYDSDQLGVRIKKNIQSNYSYIQRIENVYLLYKTIFD